MTFEIQENKPTIKETEEALKSFGIDEKDEDILRMTLDSAISGSQFEIKPDWDFPSHALAAYGRIKPKVIAIIILKEINSQVTEENIKTAKSWMGYLNAEAYVKRDTPYAKENLVILSKWTDGDLHNK